ncbi:allantoicase [Cyathus striatus]|nr:allantoicase [Cyathus striatus]
MSYERVPLDKFDQTFSTTTELSSVALGGRIVSVSDQFFAEAYHLLLVEPAPSLKGQFGPNGALYSGWETRRHNPTYDWCIIQLGTSGTIAGFDIDTANFNGNEAPQVSVYALNALPSEEPRADDLRWQEILPKANLGPNSRHLFTVPTTGRINYVKLHMYPDGGVARFRVYGQVAPIQSEDSSSFDLAHVFAGGRIVFVSDQHFGSGANLILPGRGKDMGDGWETKRSRVKGHKDWVVIKLGAAGLLEQIEIDTAHFKGNFPESCEVHALSSDSDIDWKIQNEGDLKWTLILPRTKLGPHRQHYFQLEDVEGKIYNHVRITIHPDGGIKRVRVIGRKAGVSPPDLAADHSDVHAVVDRLDRTERVSRPDVKVRLLPVLPLSPEAFAPYGQVIEAYGDHAAAPKGTKITPANAGTASKFHKLSSLVSSYEKQTGATTGISVYRCNPLKEVDAAGTTTLTVLERHSFTNQVFIPMGRGIGEGLSDPSDRYMVVVAHNAFLATTAQGIPLDFACVETQIGDGSMADCEIVNIYSSSEIIKLKVV